MYWPGDVLTSVFPNGLTHLLLWLAVRDAQCRGCGGMLHKVPGRAVADLHRCEMCERLWVKRDGACRAHVSPPHPKGPHGSRLR